MGLPLSATLEDYLGVIFCLQKEKKYARVRDIANHSSVAKSAATSALRALSRKGLIHYEPYEPVTLSPEGNEQAEQIILRRRILEDFLIKVLCLDSKKAITTACKIEHAVDRESMERLVCFLAFIHRQEGGKKYWLSKFRQFIGKRVDKRMCNDCIRDYLEQIKQNTGEPGSSASKDKV